MYAIEMLEVTKKFGNFYANDKKKMWKNQTQKII